MSLALWDKARTAIVEARSVDEVKDIRDKAEAMRLYAKQAGESLKAQNDIAEIKLRAERKAGELLRDMPKNEGAKGSGSNQHEVRSHRVSAPKLSDVGISHKQSSRFQAVAAVPDDAFEELIAETKAAEKELTTALVLKTEKVIRQAENRAEKNNRQIAEMPAGVYDVVYADPPWRYDFAETDNRAVENQYPTLDQAAICEIEIPAAKDAVLFLWATAPKLLEAIAVVGAWGFTYKTHLIWNKEKIGMGYWFRGQHELLLVATKGDFSPPPAEKRISSVFLEARTEHSKKPKYFYDWIEQAFPGRKYIELFARSSRPNWAVWGNEA